MAETSPVISVFNILYTVSQVDRLDVATCVLFDLRVARPSLTEKAPESG